MNRDMNRVVIRGYIEKNGTNSERRVGNVKCKLFGEGSKACTTILDSSCGHFHA